MVPAHQGHEGAHRQGQQEHGAADRLQAVRPSPHRMAGELLQEVPALQPVLVLPHPGLGVAGAACHGGRPEPCRRQEVRTDPAQGVPRHQGQPAPEEGPGILLDDRALKVRGVPLDGVEDAGTVLFLYGLFRHDGADIRLLFFRQLIVIVDQVGYLLQGDPQALHHGVDVVVHLLVHRPLDHSHQGGQQQEGERGFPAGEQLPRLHQEQDGHGQEDDILPVVPGKGGQEAQDAKTRQVPRLPQEPARSVKGQVPQAEGEQEEHQAEGGVLPQAHHVKGEEGEEHEEGLQGQCQPRAQPPLPHPEDKVCQHRAHGQVLACQEGPGGEGEPLAEEAPEQDGPPPQEGIEDGMVVVQQGHPVSIHVVGGDDGAEGVHIDPAGEIGQDIGQPGKEEQSEGEEVKELPVLHDVSYSCPYFFMFFTVFSCSCLPHCPFFCLPPAVNAVEIQQYQEHGPSQEEEEDEPAQGQEGKGTEEVLLRGAPYIPVKGDLHPQGAEGRQEQVRQEEDYPFPAG